MTASSTRSLAPRGRARIALDVDIVVHLVHAARFMLTLCVTAWVPWSTRHGTASLLAPCTCVHSASTNPMCTTCAMCTTCVHYASPSTVSGQRSPVRLRGDPTEWHTSRGGQCGRVALVDYHVASCNASTSHDAESIYPDCRVDVRNACAHAGAVTAAVFATARSRDCSK